MKNLNSNREKSLDPSWRKSRIAARIWLRARSGGLTGRDHALAHRLAKDPGVTDRLIDQAVASIMAGKRFKAGRA